MSVVVNIGGDFCIEPPFLDKELLSDEVKILFSKADVNIVNLECPVNKFGDTYKILKHGPHLQTNEKIFRHLAELNVSVVTLANNHLLDYGEKGVETTLQQCKKKGVLTAGAGADLKEAGMPVFIEKNNIKIGLVNCCEHEWSIATDKAAGANPLDIIDNLLAIKTAREQADFVLLIVHGGNEFYDLPRPAIKKMFRFFADNGADAIISHHTHTVSGYEVYNNVPIFYGLGNLLFTRQSQYESWHTGLTVQLKIEKGQPVTFELIPTKQSSPGYRLSVLSGNEKQDVLNKVKRLSSIIENNELLQNEWNKLVEKRTGQYLYHFSAVPAMPGKWVKSALRKMGFVNTLTPRRYLTGVINYITCESHLDIATQVLKKKLLKK